jgi:hypothetical protein
MYQPYATAIKAGAGAILLGVVWWHGFAAGRDRWRDKHDAAVEARKADNAAHAAILEALAAKAREASDKAKAASEQAHADRKTADQRFKEATDEATRTKRDLAAALRRGTVRLQDHWACPVSRASEGDAAELASGQDDAAELRNAGAADLIAAADHADAWIGWLQAEVTSTRQACGAVR